MRTDRARQTDKGLARQLIARFGIDDRLARNRIEALGPSDCLGKGFARQELARLGIQNIEKAVLWCVHDDASGFAVDRQISRDNLLRGIIVPAVFRRLLKMPDIFARIGPNGNDRGGVEAVPRFATTSIGVPRLCIGRAEIDQIGFGIIGD